MLRSLMVLSFKDPLIALFFVPLDYFKNSNKFSQSLRAQHLHQQDFLEVNFDGAILSQDHSSGISVVIRDDHGQFVSQKITGILAPDVVEAYTTTTKAASKLLL